MILNDRLDYESAVPREFLDRLVRLISYHLVQCSRIQFKGVVEIRRVDGHVLKTEISQ